mmetsp:Transcript_59624/g.184908  ORF Transcript_59624/g.184908 Transcript_59624/m.184908 type:complete len:225 (+) Transcript_59624:1440-2114(+)
MQAGADLVEPLLHLVGGHREECLHAEVQIDILQDVANALCRAHTDDAPGIVGVPLPVEELLGEHAADQALDCSVRAGRDQEPRGAANGCIPPTVVAGHTFWLKDYPLDGAVQLLVLPKVQRVDQRHERGGLPGARWAPDEAEALLAVVHALDGLQLRGVQLGEAGGRSLPLWHQGLPLLGFARGPAQKLLQQAAGHGLCPVDRTQLPRGGHQAHPKHARHAAAS